MLDLEKLPPLQISENLKNKVGLIYGGVKIGKTTFLSNLPNCLIFAFEPGIGCINQGYGINILDWIEFKSYVTQLGRPAMKEKFEYIGIDTVSAAFDACEQYVLQVNGITDLGDLAYGKGHNIFFKEFRSVINQIISYNHYGLWFTAHSKVIPHIIKDEKGLEKKINGYDIDLSDKKSSVIKKLVDISCFVAEVVNPDDTKRPLRKAYFCNNPPFYYAGTHLKDIAPSCNFTYPDIRDTILAAIKKEVGDLPVNELYVINENAATEPIGSFDEIKEQIVESAKIKISQDVENSNKIQLFIQSVVSDKSFKISQATPEIISAEDLNKILIFIDTL